MGVKMLSKKRLGLGALLLVFILGASYAVYAGSNNTACSKSCGAKAKAGGCPAMMLGACPSEGKAQACGDKEKAQAGPTAAGSMFPKGTMVSRAEVPGGMDLIFTGPDLAGIESALKAHAEQCNAGDGKTGSTCKVVAGPQEVVLSVRGDDPSGCCLGMGSAEGQSGAMGKDCEMGKSGEHSKSCMRGASCPGMKDKASGKADDKATDKAKGPEPGK
jgi:hypothetical protein